MRGGWETTLFCRRRFSRFIRFIRFGGTAASSFSPHCPFLRVEDRSRWSPWHTVLLLLLLLLFGRNFIPTVGLLLAVLLPIPVVIWGTNPYGITGKFLAITIPYGINLLVSVCHLLPAEI